MSDKEPVADLLKREIDISVANGLDLTESDNRTIFLKQFMEKYPDRKYTLKSIRPTANRYFEQKLGKGNLQKKLGSKPPKFNTKLANEISSHTTEKPSGITQEPKQGSTQKQTVFDKDGKPIQQTDQTSTVPPIKYDHWTKKGIGALFQAFMLPTKAVWPEMPSLSDEEKENLGEVWLPAFQRYGDEKLQFLVFPALATMGVMIPHFAQGRKLHKEAVAQKEKKKVDEKATEQETDRVNKLTCRFCNELFDSMHIKAHENACPKRRV